MQSLCVLKRQSRVQEAGRERSRCVLPSCAGTCRQLDELQKDLQGATQRVLASLSISDVAPPPRPGQQPAAAHCPAGQHSGRRETPCPCSLSMSPTPSLSCSPSTCTQFQFSVSMAAAAAGVGVTHHTIPSVNIRCQHAPPGQHCSGLRLQK